MGGKHEHVAKKIGLTPDQYFKRLRVAKLANRFPQVIEHLKDGKTCLSHLSLIGDKMIEANEMAAKDAEILRGTNRVYCPGCGGQSNQHVALIDVFA
jgi:hypothetical protein